MVYNLKAGGHFSMLHLATGNNQQQPVLAVENPVFRYRSNTTLAANSFFFNETGLRGSIAKNNVDGAFITQAMIGLQLGYSNELDRPNSILSYSPVINLYGLLEDQKEHSIQANRFVISPLSTMGADIGVELARNGTYLQLGFGGHIYRGKYQTGLLFSALSNVQSTTVDPVDTTSLQATDDNPYTADIKAFIIPYLYSEVSTEIGDLLSLFIKFNMGMDTTPDFKNADPTIEMFSKDPANYASNSIWKLRSASVGLKIALENLI